MALFMRRGACEDGSEVVARRAEEGIERDRNAYWTV